MPSTVLGAGDIAVNKKDKNSALVVLTFQWEERKVSKINALNVYALEMKVRGKQSREEDRGHWRKGRYHDFRQGDQERLTER